MAGGGSGGGITGIGDFSYLTKKKAPADPTAQAAAAPAPPTPEQLAAKAKADLNQSAEAARTQAIQGGRPQQNMGFQSPQDIANMRRQFFEQQRGIVGKELGAQRAEAAQGIRQQQQEAQDALQRRFAALGQSGGGAEISALTKLNQQGSDAQRAMQSQIGRGELERIGAAEQEAAIQQASGELAGGRQAEMAARDEALKREIFGEERANKLKEYDMAQQQFALDKDTTEFNRQLAEIEANFGQDAAKRARAGLLGQGGLLGTGIGGSGGLLGTGILSGGK